MIPRLLVFFFLPLAVFGQITAPAPSITVTATLPQNPPLDQLTFAVMVESGVAATLTDINAALQGTTLATASLSRVYSSVTYSSTGKSSQVLEWEYDLAVPVANMQSEAAALNAVQVQLSQGQIPLTIHYTVQGPQSSAQAQVQGCALSDLFAAARTKAQQMAAAANLNLGGVAGLSGFLSTSIGPAATAPYVIPGCSLTVTFASATPRTLTVSASRTVNVQGDQFVFTGVVDTALGASVDDAVAALPGTGITAANLSNIYGGTSPGYFPNSPDGTGLEWDFTLPVPFSKMKDTMAALQAAQQKAATKTVYAVSFSVNSAQASPDLLAAQNCTNSALISDAQAYARKVAAAAGVALGDILSVSDNSSPAPVRIGEFAAFSLGQAISGVVSYSSSVLTSPQSGCALTVQFGIQ